MRIQHLSRGDQAQYQDESDEADIRSMNALVGSTAHPRSPGRGHNIRTSWISGDNCRIWDMESESGYRGLVARRFGGRTSLLDMRIHTHACSYSHSHTHTPQAGLRPKGPCLQPRQRFGRSPEAITATDRYLSLRCFRRYCKQNEYSLIGVPTLGERNEQPSPRPPSSPILLFLPVF